MALACSYHMVGSSPARGAGYTSGSVARLQQTASHLGQSPAEYHSYIFGAEDRLIKDEPQ